MRALSIYSFYTFTAVVGFLGKVRERSSGFEPPSTQSLENTTRGSPRSRAHSWISKLRVKGVGHTKKTDVMSISGEFSTRVIAFIADAKSHPKRKLCWLQWNVCNKLNKGLKSFALFLSYLWSLMDDWSKRIQGYCGVSSVSRSK